MILANSLLLNNNDRDSQCHYGIIRLPIFFFDPLRDSTIITVLLACFPLLTDSNRFLSPRFISNREAAKNSAKNRPQTLFCIAKRLFTSITVFCCQSVSFSVKIRAIPATNRQYSALTELLRAFTRSHELKQASPTLSATRRQLPSTTALPCKEKAA